MEVETEAPAAAADLATVLEHAALMAKQLPSAADQSQLLRIQSALHAAHHRLSLFLTPQAENSVSSAVGGGEEDGEPMQMEGGDGEEAAASAVEKVAWRMKECFIQNKRPKRQLSPSAAAAEQRRSFEYEAAAEEFDPLRTKLRALDLIQQFHA